MNYKLNQADLAKENDKGVLGTAWKRLVPLMAKERQTMVFAVFAILVSSVATLVAPMLIAHVIDQYIRTKDYSGIMTYAGFLLVIFAIGAGASYFQIWTMGGVGRRVLFNLRNAIFSKLQELPMAFFNQNKEGDLISRINNDTEKLNQFFAQALVQFIGNLVLIVGTGIAILIINWRLGLAALVPAATVLILTRVLTAWLKKTNLRSLKALGGMSGEIQESLNNFKVIVAFNRLDYFRDKFREVNQATYDSSISAGVASNTLNPLYTLASVSAQIVVVAYGISLITTSQFSIGLLIGFILYVNNFYTPLRQLAAVWSSLQLALAGLDRISEVLSLESTMKVSVSSNETALINKGLLSFDKVSFTYPEGKTVLSDVSFTLEEGKSYALVGPTGGGKTTTASLMARLYDPTSGNVYLREKNLQSFAPEERVREIGFILQEPFLFTGTIAENIIYGNEKLISLSLEELTAFLDKKGLSELMSRFDQGLATKITSGGNGISLGQKQIIAFIRAVLREPSILILDEATANIDTVTEGVLEEILKKLPAKTTRVIIAHRLNTIENADEIFFVGGGSVKPAGTLEHAVEMLLHHKRQS